MTTIVLARIDGHLLQVVGRGTSALVMSQPRWGYGCVWPVERVPSDLGPTLRTMRRG